MFARPRCQAALLAIFLASTLLACHASATAGRFPHAAIAPDPAKPLPTLALSLTGGRPFRLADYQGKWLWVYLGYANCPDVCPAALDAMNAEYKRLRHPEAVQGVFVSVDPARDTPAKLATFVHYYNPRFLGVTGDRPALDALAKALGAGYVLDKPDKPGANYNVSHTNLLFVIDPQGRYAATYVPGAAAGDLAHDFNALATGAP